MRSQGFALIEVLVASILSAFIVGSLATAFAVTVSHQQRFSEPRRRFETENYLEDKLRDLLSRAVFTNDADGTTFFEATSISGDSSASDTLRFTIVGERVPGPVGDSDEADFAKRNQQFGAVGGVTEVSISTTPVGDSGGLEGVFIRRQTPSDSDHESGGFESVLDPDVTQISIEFWDSTAWIATWDTAEEGRLPEALRVSYRRNGDETDRIIVVRMPNGQGAQAQ